MGPYQPRLAEYPRSQFGIQYRRFQSKWFKTFPWMEYSPEKDAMFCFPCYLFENGNKPQCTLTKEGFRCWKRVNDGANCPFLTHIGSINSPHRKSVKSVEDLSNVTRRIDKVINVQTSEDVRKNRLRLMVTTEAIRWLSLQGCAFRGHREDSTSKNRGNLIEMVKLLGRLNVNIEDVILDNAPRNATYTSPKIQKEILQIMANMVRNKIREEIGDGKFCLLVDEAKDSSSKEEMAIVLRFVDGQGSVKERFFDIVEVENILLHQH
ncbi:hypothetical protein Sjap_012606 [Stephania japonica]|uniref:TTF-type domain-containing protein n=1 Tax=Stephania japonica TaxID=461633 RepID=A0AAP0IWE1_9MAGN